MERYLSILICRTTAVVLFLLCVFTATSYATVATVQDQEAKYKYIPPTEKLPSKYDVLTPDELATSLYVDVTQGVDTNPLLDSTHKADNYTQEVVDMHFAGDMGKSPFGPATLRFGANALNVNYYRITDVNIFDGKADAGLDFDICENLTMSVNYVFEALWFPHASSGTYLANEVNCSFKQKIVDWLYQRGTYRYIYRNYSSRKILLGNGNLGSQLRRDERNVVRHEVGMYVGKLSKIKVVNTFFWNESNYQYLDYYDYNAFRTGGSLITTLMPKLYGIGSFYYMRKRYDARTLSDNPQSTQRDNLYTVTGSLIYEATKSLSLYLSYSHFENHTNEPLERYSDTLYSAGLTYAF